MKPALIALLALAVAGCGSSLWKKPDTTGDQAQEDLRTCEEAAYRQANAVRQPYPTMGPVILQDATGRRFNVHPVGPFADPEGTRYLKETRLARECMRAKGYELVPPR